MFPTIHRAEVYRYPSLRTIIFFVLALCFSTITSSQSCLPEGITFTTQAQIDSFQINYPGCTEIEGFVQVMGDKISNFDSLIGLTSIGGLGLWIIECPSLGSLSPGVYYCVMRSERGVSTLKMIKQ